MSLSDPQRMLLICVILFMTLKVLMQLRTHRALSLRGWLLWTMGTPTLNARDFFNARAPRPVEWSGLASAAVFTAMGILLIVVVVPGLADETPWLAGWCGMIGLIASMHFGLLHGIIVLWRAAGRVVQPLMNAPWMSVSLAEFWGRRWNTAFRDAARDLILLPLSRRTGTPVAGFLCYLFSGLIHELAISVPAGHGFGGPTAYFLIQWAGQMIEKKQAAAKRIQRLPILLQRALTLAIVLAPAPLLFHQAFLNNVILPLILSGP